MIVQFRFRRGTSSEWSSVNPILGSGEPGFDTSNDRFKIGDGLTPWNVLPYQSVDLTALSRAVASADASLSAIEAAAAGVLDAADRAASTTDHLMATRISDQTSESYNAVAALISSLGGGGGGGGGVGDVTLSQLQAELANVRSETPSLEETLVSTSVLWANEPNPTILTGVGVTREFTAITAPFPMRILSWDFTFNVKVAPSPTAYYTVVAKRTRAAGVAENILSTQNSIAKGFPTDGWWEWTAPVVESYRILARGDSFGFEFTGTGTSAVPLIGPVSVTIRYARA